MTALKMLPEESEYPGSELLYGARRGVFYTYIPSTVLDGFAMLTEPVCGWLLERYARLDRDALRVAADARGHRELSDLGDDVVLLAQDREWPERLWFFWFDRDVSDCSMGWSDAMSVAAARADVEAWLTGLVVDGAARKGAERTNWECPSDWTRIPPEYFANGYSVSW